MGRVNQNSRAGPGPPSEAALPAQHVLDSLTPSRDPWALLAIIPHHPSSSVDHPLGPPSDQATPELRSRGRQAFHGPQARPNGGAGTAACYTRIPTPTPSPKQTGRSTYTHALSRNPVRDKKRGVNGFPDVCLEEIETPRAGCDARSRT